MQGGMGRNWRRCTDAQQREDPSPSAPVRNHSGPFVRKLPVRSSRFLPVQPPCLRIQLCIPDFSLGLGTLAGSSLPSWVSKAQPSPVSGLHSRLPCFLFSSVANIYCWANCSGSQENGDSLEGVGSGWQGISSLQSPLQSPCFWDP